MSQDQNSTGTPAIPGRASEGNGATPPRGASGNDGFLSSLAELENRISSLKAMHEQATTRDIEHSERERRMAEREASLAVKESALAEREASLAERERSAAQTTETFEQSRADLDERSRALAARAEELAAREAALAQREATGAAQLEDARKAFAEADLLSRQMAEREAVLAEENAAMMRREDNIEMKIEGAERLREQIMSRGAEIAAREARISRELAELNARAKQFENESADRRAELERAEADLAERERALSARAVKAEAELNRVAREQEETDAARAELDSTRRDLDAARAEIDADREGLGADRARLDAGLEELNADRAGLEAERKALESDRASADASRERLEAESAALAEGRKELQADRADLDAIKEALDKDRARLEATRKEIEVAQAKLEAARKDIHESRAELVAAGKDLEARRADIALKREEIEAFRAEVESREKNITDRARQLAESRAAFENDQKQAAERIRADEEALNHREDQIREREIDLATQRDELDRERAGVTEQARTLAAQLKAQDDDQAAAIWSNRVEHMQIELGQATADRARLETEVAQLRKNIESMTQEIIDSNQNRGVPEAEVQIRERRIAELTASLEESRVIAATLQERIDTLEKSVREAEDARAREAEGREDETRAHNERMAAHARQLDEALRRAEQADAEKSGMVPRSEHEKLERELDAARELLDQAEADAQSRVPVEEVVKRNETISKLEKALEQAEAAAGDLATQQLEAKEAQIADLRERLAEAVSDAAGPNSPVVKELARISDEAEDLRARLREAEHALESARKSAEPDDRDELIAELRARLEAAGRADVSSTTDAAESNAETVELRARLDAALAEIETLREHQAGGDVGEETETGPSGPTPAELLRRDRLRRYKGLLQTQARKIVAAQAALQRRHADCEVVLTNRARLVEMAQQLARAEKRLTASKARSGAVSALLYFVATLGILAGLSWEVSRRIWPGTYIARCVLDADAGRRTPSADDLKQWQKDYQDLLVDPRLMEMAAERMQRRGLTQISDPAGLASRLKQDLYVQSAHPGSLTVELRGEGAERTALFLDTFVTSFKAFADQSRDERANDIGVTIAQAATPGTEPLMDKRIERAGSVFGGAVLATGLAGLVIWSRLVRAKRKFDHAAAVEAALEEVDWGTLEASIKKHSGKDGAATGTS